MFIDFETALDEDAVVDAGSRLGMSSKVPAKNRDLILVASERVPASSGESVLCSFNPAVSVSIDLSSCPKRYTPPPTAPALQATCDISELPPYFAMTAPKPGPKYPIDRICLRILARALSNGIEFAGTGERASANNGDCRDAGTRKVVSRAV